LFFFSSRRRHTRSKRDWSSDVCSSDLAGLENKRSGGRCKPDKLHERITHRELNFFRLRPLSISSEQSDLLIRVVQRELFRPCFRGGKAFFITKRGKFHPETTVITHCSSDTPSYAYFSGDAFSIYLGYGDAYSSFSRYDCRCYCSSFSRLEMERSGENDGKWSVACASCNIYPLDHWNDHWYV